MAARSRAGRLDRPRWEGTLELLALTFELAREVGHVLLQLGATELQILVFAAQRLRLLVRHNLLRALSLIGLGPG